jgi:hypothetical protein
MSSGGSPPPESLDASGLPIPDGGGSTSVPAGWRPFKVSLIASNERSMRASSNDGGGGGVVLVAWVAPVMMLPGLDLFESWPSGMT